MRRYVLSIAVLTAALIPAARAVQDASPQAAASTQQNPFDRALARAKKEGRYLLVAVLAREQAESAQFDAETLRSPRVQAWLEHKGILLRFYDDEPIGRNFATSHGIDTLPTIVILASDGRELGRQIGFMAAPRFMIKINGAIGSKAIRGEGGVRSWSGEDVVVSTVKRATKLTEQGKHAEAMDEFMWCLNHRATNSPLFPITHLPKLVNGFVALAKVYEPAMKELNVRLAKTTAAVAKSARPRVHDYYFLKYAYLALDREEMLVELYDRLQKSFPDGNAPRAFGRLIYEPLLHARRYKDLARTVDDPESVDLFLDESRQAHRAATDVSTLLANRYEILLGLGEVRYAKDVEKKLLSYDRSAGGYLALAAAALRSGKSTDEHIALARKANDMFGQTNARAIDVLARLLAARSPRDPQVIQMLRIAMERMNTDADRAVIAKCIADVQHNRVPKRADTD